MEEVKFLDLKKLNMKYTRALTEDFQRVLESGWYIMGDHLRQFEQDFAQYTGARYAVGISNGLDALTLIFRAYMEMGHLKAGDRVIVPANTYIASILAVVNNHLEPVFVEPDISSYNLQYPQIREALERDSKIKAVLGVHLYGQLIEYNHELDVLMKDKGVLFVEDAAQSHGARNTNGVAAGNLGHAAGFSFYPGKNLGALGDAGAVTTNDEELRDAIVSLRNYGSSKKYYNDYKGFNNRLDELQSAFLITRLKGLDAENESRRVVARQYLKAINNSSIELPAWSGTQDHVFHLFVVRTKNREALREHLIKNGVQTVIHYPVPPHKQKAFAEFNHLQLPATEAIHEEVLSLPISPVMEQGDINRVIEAVNSYR